MFDIPVDLKSLEKEIIAYENEPIETGKILFYGHSLFTRWGGAAWGYRRMDEDLRGKDGSLAVVNHGFGTSTSEEMLYYYPRMVRPWAPRALVLASFSNDGMYGYSVEQIMDNMVKLMHWARTDFPGIRIYLVQAHPMPLENTSPLPDKWNAGYRRRTKYNEMLEIYAQTHEDTQVIRLWDEPRLFVSPDDVGDPHKVREDIFVADKVHPNQAGYDILAEVFREALKDVL